MDVGDCGEKGCWNEERGAAGEGICVGFCRERVGRKGRELWGRDEGRGLWGRDEGRGLWGGDCGEGIVGKG